MLLLKREARSECRRGSRLTLKAGAFALLVLAAGCGDATGFLGIPKQEPPVAVITAPPGPLNTLTNYLADGTASHDPQGSIVTWSWAITQMPPGSLITLAEDSSVTDGSKMDFQPDLIGSYEITLVVTDDAGLQSAPAVYDFQAGDKSGLRVELTWNTDYTDLDLHLTDQTAGGTFFTTPDDCYFQNPNPAWGGAGDPAADPDYPHDVTNGYGPEVTGIASPRAAAYHIYTHYYCDEGFGESVATIKVYSQGVQIGSDLVGTVVHTGDLWDVATVTVGTNGAATLVVSTAGITTVDEGCE